MKANVDAIVVRDNRVFAYGWAFMSASVIESLWLEATLVDGSKISLPLSYGKARQDVATVFPDEQQALYSGWLAYAAWEGAVAESFALAGVLQDGSPVSMVLPASAVDLAGEVPLPPDPPTLPQRAITRLRKLIGAESGEPAVVAPEISFKPPEGVSAAAMLERLSAALRSAGQPHCSLTIDHDMGGGANHYRKQWMAAAEARRPVALLLGFEISTLRYFLEIVVAGIPERFFLSDDAIVELLVQSLLVDEVFYNDAVSFPRPVDVPRWLMAFKRIRGVRLKIAVHDYFSVCPSQFLLNDSGRFCGIPEIGECMRCLPKNDNEFAVLFTDRDMPEWRKAWSEVLMAADDIVCFSQSSSQLLLRAYPRLVAANLRVEPHSVESFDRPAHIDLSGPLHIGVVGSIGIHKGARVLQRLADEVRRRASDVRITVIGSVDLPCDSGVLQTTGAFERAALPGLIEKSGINVFLLPSICPETFSYVTQELMSLGVPLACFDLGAPADRVAAYARGQVLTCQEAGPLLDELLHFHQALTADNQRNPS